MLAIVHALVVTPDAALEDGSVLIDGGQITAVAPADRLAIPSDAQLIDARGLILAPGFIDLQFNGAFGHDFTADPASIWSVAARLTRWGVTGFLPTIITAPLATYAAAQEVMLDGAPAGWRGARPLGLHFEGPFLNPDKKGAHNAALMMSPMPTAVANWSRDTAVALVTLAPERPGALAVIAALAERGVLVSAGHSTATYAEAKAGIEAGLRYSTHLFNAMRSLHHREPGLVVAMLNDPRVTVGLIPDGIHVHPALIETIWHASHGRVNLVTDAMAAAGMPPGRYRLGGSEVQVGAGRAQLADGTLAGSVVDLPAAVANFRQYTRCTLPEAIAAVTHTPARLLGLARKGRIAPGYDADLVLLDAALAVQLTAVAGDILFKKPGF